MPGHLRGTWAAGMCVSVLLQTMSLRHQERGKLAVRLGVQRREGGPASPLWGMGQAHLSDASVGGKNAAAGLSAARDYRKSPAA